MRPAETCPVLTHKPRDGGFPTALLDYRNPALGERQATLPVTGARVVIATDKLLLTTVYKDPRFSIAKVDPLEFGLIGTSHRSSLFDGKDALRLRHPMALSLSRRGLEMREGDFTKSAQTHAKRFAGQPEPSDLITGFCSPFIAEVASGVLGIPVEKWPDIKQITRSALRIRQTPDDEQAIDASWRKVYGHAGSLAESKRLAPDGTVFSDIVARQDKAGLTKEEVSHMIGALSTGLSSAELGLIVGAHEMMKRPDLIKECNKNPALWPKVVEELLRYKAHFTIGNPRIALEDVTLEDGRVIEKGTVVVPSITAAVHDPASVDKPDEFDPDQKANRIDVFGDGPHVCPGANLTRLWLRVGLKELFAKMPNLHLAVPEEDLVWKEGLMSTPEEMPVEWTAKAA